MARYSIPGWYEDPVDTTSVRWWDGDSWSHHTQKKPELPSESEETNHTDNSYMAEENTQFQQNSSNHSYFIQEIRFDSSSLGEFYSHEIRNKETPTSFTSDGAPLVSARIPETNIDKCIIVPTNSKDFINDEHGLSLIQENKRQLKKIKLRKLLGAVAILGITISGILIIIFIST